MDAVDISGLYALSIGVGLRSVRRFLLICQDTKHIMAGSRRSNHRSSISKQKESSSRRSKLYERYNVKVEEEVKEEEIKPLNQRPIQELSNVELCKLILQNLLSYLKTNKLISIIILMLLIIIIDEILASIDNTSSSTIDTTATTDKAKKPFGQLDADSHKRNNPFAEEGSYTVMEGFLEVKRVGNKTKQELELQEMYNSKTKAWWSHLCPDKRFELERDEEVQNCHINGPFKCLEKTALILNMNTAKITLYQ